MPDLTGDFQSSDYNPHTLSGSYAYNRIQQFVQEIHAAAYPHTPQEVGGRPYGYCAEYLEQCENIIGADDRNNLPPKKKEAIRNGAIETVNKMVADLSLVSDLNASEQRYLDEFTFYKSIIDRISDGEKIEDIKTFIKTGPIGHDPSP